MKKVSFKRWLLSQRSRNDIIGDFAKDAHGDAGLPTTPLSIKRYLIQTGACAGALEALKEAQEEFKKNPTLGRPREPKKPEQLFPVHMSLATEDYNKSTEMVGFLDFFCDLNEEVAIGAYFFPARQDLHTYEEYLTHFGKVPHLSTIKVYKNKDGCDA